MMPQATLAPALPVFLLSSAWKRSCYNLQSDLVTSPGPLCPVRGRPARREQQLLCLQRPSLRRLRV